MRSYLHGDCRRSHYISPFVRRSRSFSQTTSIHCIQLRETYHKSSDTNTLDLSKITFSRVSAPVGPAIFNLALIEAANEEKNDELEILLMDAQVAVISTCDMKQRQLAVANAFKDILKCGNLK